MAVPWQVRFWRFVIRGGPDECWLWHGSTTGHSGYGKLRVGGRSGRDHPAHRLSYILHKGPIPDGHDACHSCDVRYAPGDKTYRRCVNPAHLWAGTRSENLLDAGRKGRLSNRPQNFSITGPNQPPRWRFKQRSKSHGD